MKDVSLSNLTSDGLLTAEKNQVQAIIDKIMIRKTKNRNISIRFKKRKTL